MTAGFSITDESGARVDIRPRCDIADCDVPPAVCGAGIPVIRDIAAGRIEVEWDGMMSVIDPVRACETRRPAPPGRYVATFCHSRQASFVGEGDTKVGVQGSLVQPTCARSRSRGRERIPCSTRSPLATPGRSHS